MATIEAGAGDAPTKLFRGYDGIANGMLNESAVTGGSDDHGGGRTVVKIGRASCRERVLACV